MWSLYQLLVNAAARNGENSMLTTIQQNMIFFLSVLLSSEMLFWKPFDRSSENLSGIWAFPGRNHSGNLTIQLLHTRLDQDLLTCSCKSQSCQVIFLFHKNQKKIKLSVFGPLGRTTTYWDWVSGLLIH